MIGIPDIPRVAVLLSDTARAAILWTLIDGSTRAASELAFAANNSAQSASRHLALLVNGGLLEAQPRGRQRRFRIANSEAACLVESMAALSAGIEPRERLPAPPARPMPRELAALNVGLAVAREQRRVFARPCADVTQGRPHLGGALGAALLEACVANGWILRSRRSRVVSVTPRGHGVFAELTRAAP